MYKQCLEVQDSKTGKGVFTTIQIPANVPIMEVTGPLWTEREIPDPEPQALLQVGPNTYLGPSGDVDDYVNHSCDPNCMMHVVGNRAILFSLYVIPAGAELTFDYATTSTDTVDSWKMNCKCGSNKCRKTISGYQYLSPETFTAYEKKNMLPLYILMPGMIQKR